MFSLFELDKSFLLVDCWTPFICFLLCFLGFRLSLFSLAWNYWPLWLIISSFRLWLQSFECIWVWIYLPSYCVVILLHLSVNKSNLTENFTHFSQTINLSDVISLTVQKFHSCLLNLGLFLLTVAGVVNATSVRQCVMHGKFLFQLLDLSFIALYHVVRVANDVDGSFVVDFHHTACEQQCCPQLFEVCSLRPYICDHHSLAVATNTIPKHVGKFGLAIRNVFSFAIAQCKHHLLKERQRFVDERSLLEHQSFRMSLFGSFAARQINQMQLAVHNLVTRLDSRSRLNVHGKDWVSTTWSCIQVVSSERAIHFSFEQAI